MSSATATLKPARPSVLLKRYAWAVLIYNVAVILWGAVMRATQRAKELAG